MKALGSLDSYGKLLENQEKGGSRELFLPENVFQTSSTKICLKKHPYFGDLEPSEDIKFRIEFFSRCYI